MLPLCFAFLLVSCAVQDHQNPQPVSCRVTEIKSNLDYYKLKPGETVSIGQVVIGRETGYPVIDIIKIGDDFYAVGGPEVSTTYAYNSEGKVQKSTTTGRALSNSILISEYAYGTNQLTQIDKQKLRAVPDTSVTSRVYNLNSDGLIILDNTTYQNGYIVEERYSGYTTNYTLNNGNVIKREQSNSSTPVVYEFDWSKPNPIPNLLPFRGKLNINQLIKTYYENGQVYEDHQYIYDANGKIKFSIGILKRPQEPDRYTINHYTFDCPTPL
ncbi:hypothetical protein GCM10027347_40380 [Larkinella harenae]